MNISKSLVLFVPFVFAACGSNASNRPVGNASSYSPYSSVNRGNAYSSAQTNSNGLGASSLAGDTSSLNRASNSSVMQSSLNSNQSTASRSAATENTSQTNKPGLGSSAITGLWSGVSRGERITVKFGANGSLILTNTAGANPGTWSSQRGGAYQVNIGGATGQFVMVNSTTASLTVDGSAIELRKN